MARSERDGEASTVGAINRHRGEAGTCETTRRLFQRFDLLILQLDADVAACNYQNDSITPMATDGAIPCEQPCPPPSATTDALAGGLVKLVRRNGHACKNRDMHAVEEYGSLGCRCAVSRR